MILKIPSYASFSNKESAPKVIIVNFRTDKPKLQNLSLLMPRSSSKSNQFVRVQVCQPSSSSLHSNALCKLKAWTCSTRPFQHRLIILQVVQRKQVCQIWRVWRTKQRFSFQAPREEHHRKLTPRAVPKLSTWRRWKTLWQSRNYSICKRGKMSRKRRRQSSKRDPRRSNLSRHLTSWPCLKTMKTCWRWWAWRNRMCRCRPPEMPAEPRWLSFLRARNSSTNGKVSLPLVSKVPLHKSRLSSQPELSHKWGKRRTTQRSLWVLLIKQDRCQKLQRL